MSGGCFIMEAEDGAEDIEICEALDGRIGIILRNSVKSMHAPLNPDAARVIANAILKAADDAERAPMTTETLN